MAERTTSNYNGTIDLSILRKKRFTINDDENKVLELNTSDLSITTRLSESYPRLVELANSITTISDGVSETDENIVEDLSIMSQNLKKIDAQMREIIDYIFDSNVSELCASDGSMYDPIGGELRYEHILTILMGLYEENLAKEMKAVQAKMKKHTAKYTKK